MHTGHMHLYRSAAYIFLFSARLYIINIVKKLFLKVWWIFYFFELFWTRQFNLHAEYLGCFHFFPVTHAAAAAAKSLQLCPTLCDPIDGSPPGSPVPGIRQARTLEWVAISFSNAWKWTVKVKSLSRVRLSATPWTAAYQAPPSMGFSRQE